VIGGSPPYIAWQVQPNVTAWDLCKQYGDINVSVAVVDDAVRNRGGQITLDAWVMFRDIRTHATGNWIKLRLMETWPTPVFRPPNGQNVSMNSTTETRWVAIRSTFWLKKDASNWVPMSQALTYCTLGSATVQSSRPPPGPCYAG